MRRKKTRAIGWCPVHEKLLYESRSIAKQIAREHRGEHMNEYRCEEIVDLWHVGTLPLKVINGEMTRSSYYQAAS